MAAVGEQLEQLLDAATIMGADAYVEVHTPNELDYALEKLATNFIINMRDRITGRLYPSQARHLAPMLPVNCVSLAAGNIHCIEQVIELGLCGYDGVVLGRNIAEIPDLKEFVDSVHLFEGPPRTMGLGMKSINWGDGNDNFKFT
jgi:indole-3-glycerol phosphate synthase